MSIARIYAFGNENTYWSVAITPNSTVQDVTEELATRLLSDDEIFLMLEQKISKLKSPKKDSSLNTGIFSCLATTKGSRTTVG